MDIVEGLTKPNQEVLDAVAFIFDNGGYIVQHRLTYFYSFNNTKSRFHESKIHTRLWGS